MDKIFTGYLLLNWKSGEWKVHKRPPKIVGESGYWIPIRLNLTVSIPPTPSYVAKGRIELSEAKVSDIAIEELSDGS